MAEIHFKRGQLKQAEAACDALIKSSSYDYWIVKSYVLIADIYVEQNELEQAQATLQSIVDNYTGDQDLLNEARSKLDAVNRQLDQKSRIRTQGELFQE
jgi:predicted Zn-dependent protease